ncbi:penicillin-binding protein 1C [Alteromonadaceae bacterium Bs31]|nr:penicillin-binding protein 1C [Alteromonadaceae bacterium Bs31]
MAAYRTARMKKIKTAFIFAGLVLSALLIIDRVLPLSLPSQSDLFARVVVDRDGRPLRAFPDSKGVWRYAVELEEISPLYLDSLLTYEDRRFWYHLGLDPLAIFRAAFSNLKNGKVVSGGSTISMQVARLLHPHSKTIGGKLYQIFRTFQLEFHLSKKEILSLYCNIAPFGGTIEGVQAASYTYLNKPASELSHAEAALLAVLPQSPTRYRPDLHPQKAQQARDKVLERMVKLNVWPEALVQEAKLEAVYAHRRSPERHAPLLARKLISEAQKNKQLKSVISSTLDGELQRSLEDYLKYYIEGQAEKTSAAALVVDNRTQEVISYIGTADFGNPERFGHVDMVQAIRSPGSTLKPFLYALAFDQGLIHSHSLLSDTPQNWQEYRPGNFSGGFAGPVSATEALQRSLNIPAVSLLEKVGAKNFNAQLHNAGLKLQIPDNEANLSIILGGAGTSLEQLVQAYSLFAHGGQVHKLKYSRQPRETPTRFFVSQKAAWLTHTILRGVDRPGSVRAFSSLAMAKKMAWKTGTSYGFRDSWAIGVDRNYTIGVWVGRPDGTPNPGASGRSNAGPLLHAIADHLPDARLAIQQPDNIQQQSICWPLGTLESEQKKEHCHKRLKAWIIDDTVPPTGVTQQGSLLGNPYTYWLDTHTGKRVHSYCKTEQRVKNTVALWPASLEPWLAEKHRRHKQIPALSENCSQLVANFSGLQITALEEGSIFQSPVNMSTAPNIPLQASGGEGKQDWYVNGLYHHSAYAMNAASLQLKQKGEYQIVVSDESGNVDKVNIRYQ